MSIRLDNVQLYKQIKFVFCDTQSDPYIFFQKHIMELIFRSCQYKPGICDQLSEDGRRRHELFLFCFLF